MEYNFTVVAIGSSAGGLSPLKEIISRIPKGTNAAIVIVSHLSTQYKSRLHDLLAKVSELEVVKAVDQTRLEPGKIFVMPEGKMMTVANGNLVLRDRLPSEKINKAIDIFFKSLATDVKDKCIGIILSGAGYDGLEGAKQIEANQGIIIAQDPDTAQFPLMPSSLIANNDPNFVLTPEAIVSNILDKIQTLNTD
uniref:chemotaxis protein CheB n=1 Tax=Mucilaginibacter sp. Bleaf8 TaxID=2834430 RepID=UPI001BD110F5|nr:chemotaxis protein CheB [Mucilaginibacter sp. Bleaf8]